MNSHCKIGKVKPKLTVVEPMPMIVNDRAVALAEEILNELKSGELRSFGYIALDSKGYAHNAFELSDRQNIVHLLGAAQRLSNRINKEVSNDSAYY